MINEIMGIIAKNRRIKVGLGLALVCLIGISIGFAALTVTLNISFGDITQNALSWNVGFKGSVAHGTFSGTSDMGSTCGDATITPGTVTISGTALSKPGDTCTYQLTIKNNGQVPAKLSGIGAVEPSGTDCSIDGSTMVCGNLTYKLLAVDNTALTTGVIINNEENYKLKLVVSFSGDTLSTTEVHQSGGKFVLNYSQAEIRTDTNNELPLGVSNTKCVRASVLHTEECTAYYSGSPERYCYGAGYRVDGTKGTTTITYGSLGTPGTLTSGDAFDCDVNGDGVYDPEKERFYYVSQVDGDDTNNYAVLIYYNNVSGGVANNTEKFSYDPSSKNSSGPITPYLQLPTTEQWSNVVLLNQTRQIYAENGAVTTNSGSLPLFTYTDRAARLLSYKELNKACNLTIGSSNTIGDLDKSCEYLLENTEYGSRNVTPPGYWLETPLSSSINGAWYVLGWVRYIASSRTEYTQGVRPVIEVRNIDIDYY